MRMKLTLPLVAAATLLAACDGSEPKIEALATRNGPATLFLYEEPCRLPEFGGAPGWKDAKEVADNNNRIGACYTVKDGMVLVDFEDSRGPSMVPLAAFARISY